MKKVTGDYNPAPKQTPKQFACPKCRIVFESDEYQPKGGWFKNKLAVDTCPRCQRMVEELEVVD